MSGSSANTPPLAIPETLHATFFVQSVFKHSGTLDALQIDKNTTALRTSIQPIKRSIPCFNTFRIVSLAFIIVSIFGCVGDGSRKGNLPNINSIAGTDTIPNAFPVDSALFNLGKALFIRDCNACHVTKGRLHNYLEGVVDRVGKNYLKLYLTKQDSLTSARDTNAIHLKEVWGNMANSHNFKYSDKELTAIIEYLK